MSSTLTITNLSAAFGARPLFSGLELAIGPGAVVGVVGPNGSGKSTLLRTIAGQLPVESGRIQLGPPDSTVGYLPQEVPGTDETITGYVARRTGVEAASREFEEAAQALADDSPGAADRYDKALDRWMRLGAGDLDIRLTELLHQVGLGLDPDRPLGSLSGGQVARVSLVSVLASRFDVLLLDEPTNNLDDAGLSLVTDFVREVDVPVLVASHDRAFLDAVATEVLELDIHQQQVHHFVGGWTRSREAKQLLRSQAVEARETYEAKRDALVERARRQNEWAEQGRRNGANLGDHMQKYRRFLNDRAKKQDQKAARTRAAVERLEEAPELRKEWQLQYSLASAPEPAEVVCTLDGVVAAAGGFRIGPLAATVERGDRVALVGQNGSGKSTLLRALLGDGSTLEAGRISWGTRTAIGSLDQERSAIGPDELLGQAVATRLGILPGEARTLLAKFGLGAEHVARPWRSLSLGERTRALMALWQQQPTNVLVLDEPTNHLDVEAIEQLQEALAGYAGTVLLVTHDAQLREAFGATQTWTCRRDGDHAEVEVVRG